VTTAPAAEATGSFPYPFYGTVYLANQKTELVEVEQPKVEEPAPVVETTPAPRVEEPEETPVIEPAAEPTPPAPIKERKRVLKD
jgi:hypothetical protein